MIYDGASSSGRTADFDSANPGSNPGAPSNGKSPSSTEAVRLSHSAVRFDSGEGQGTPIQGPSNLELVGEGGPGAVYPGSSS